MSLPSEFTDFELCGIPFAFNVCIMCGVSFQHRCLFVAPALSSLGHCILYGLVSEQPALPSFNTKWDVTCCHVRSFCVSGTGSASLCGN